MRMIKFRAKRVNGGEWVKSMTISYGTIKRKMYNVFFEVEPNKWVGVIPETVCQLSDGRYLPPKEAVQQCYNAFGIRVGLGDNWEDIYDGWNKEMK